MINITTSTILQYVNVSKCHSVHFKLTQYYVPSLLNKKEKAIGLPKCINLLKSIWLIVCPDELLLSYINIYLINIVTLKVR